MAAYDFVTLPLRGARNGVPLSEGSGVTVLGDPLRALARVAPDLAPAPYPRRARLAGCYGRLRAAPKVSVEAHADYGKLRNGDLFWSSKFS
ncbi:MAG TPA: hypothetical protein VFB54_15400 [Burkholderiales bacterium]|nr:hypothetical protein [Burkholderiales bacterium]